MPTTRHRGIVMTQEQLMKVKIKYLEDRLTTMEKSLGRIHKVMAHYQMIEDKEQGFKDIDTRTHDHELI